MKPPALILLRLGRRSLSSFAPAWLVRPAVIEASERAQQHGGPGPGTRWGWGAGAIALAGAVAAAAAPAALAERGYGQPDATPEQLRAEFAAWMREQGGHMDGVTLGPSREVGRRGGAGGTSGATAAG
jgi:hypothetical protein